MSSCHLRLAADVSFKFYLGVDEVGTHGGWAGSHSKHLLVSYLTIPSHRAMRELAGVNPNGGGYNVPHLENLPGDDLVGLFMPNLVTALNLERRKSSLDQARRTTRFAFTLISNP